MPVLRSFLSLSVFWFVSSHSPFYSSARFNIAPFFVCPELSFPVADLIQQPNRHSEPPHLAYTMARLVTPSHPREDETSTPIPATQRISKQGFSPRSDSLRADSHVGSQKIIMSSPKTEIVKSKVQLSQALKLVVASVAQQHHIAMLAILLDLISWFALFGAFLGVYSIQLWNDSSSRLPSFGTFIVAIATWILFVHVRIRQYRLDAERVGKAQVAIWI